MKKLVEVELMVHRETLEAVHVSDCGEQSQAKWIPISQISNWEAVAGQLSGVPGKGASPTAAMQRAVVCILQIPEWLAVEKGFSADPFMADGADLFGEWQ